MTDLEEPPNWRVRVEDADFEEGIRVVVMPCCGFSFDAIHADLDGETYSCPSCCSERLEAENERLVKRLQAVRREARRQIRGDGIRVEYRHAMQVAGRHILVILEHKQA